MKNIERLAVVEEVNKTGKHVCYAFQKGEGGFIDKMGRYWPLAVLLDKEQQISSVKDRITILALWAV